MTNCTKEARNDVVKTHNDVIDLVSRQAAIDAVYERIKQIGYENSLPILSIGQAIRDLPSAQPKTGTWIRHERGLFFGYKCSQCGELSEIPTDYCPHCGAKMKGGDSDD